MERPLPKATLKVAFSMLIFKKMRNATLTILIKDGKILLAMKKRGFGQGKWNGTGGKVKDGEEIMEAAVRETEEEIGIKAIDLEKVAKLDFHFPYKKEWDQSVHVFLIKSWEGDPTESEEMMPKWFNLKEIPYNDMWDDDKFWLPQVISGKKLEAKFTFKEGEEIIDKNIKLI